MSVEGANMLVVTAGWNGFTALACVEVFQIVADHPHLKRINVDGCLPEALICARSLP